MPTVQQHWSKLKTLLDEHNVQLRASLHQTAAGQLRETLCLAGTPSKLRRHSHQATWVKSSLLSEQTASLVKEATC